MGGDGDLPLRRADGLRSLLAPGGEKRLLTDLTATMGPSSLRWLPTALAGFGDGDRDDEAVVRTLRSQFKVAVTQPECNVAATQPHRSHHTYTNTNEQAHHTTSHERHVQAGSFSRVHTVMSHSVEPLGIP